MLRELIDSTPALRDRRAGRPPDHYGALVRSIVGQQLSVSAARAIYGRLTERFGGRPPTPHEILADDPEELRPAAGLSHAKVGFLRSLAEHVVSGELELERPDGLPVGDLGIRRAIERAYGLGELPSPAETERLAEPWRPYRTLACRYLWASLRNEPA